MDNESRELLVQIHNAAVDAWDRLDGDADRQYLLEDLCQRIFRVTGPIFEEVTEQLSR